MRSNSSRVVVRTLWALALVLLMNRAGASDLGINTVFIILMENHDWATIKGMTNCPYINNVLLPKASYCTSYYNPPSLHPSEPNYIWLESGTNFGITNDLASNRISSTNHLVTQLHNAGISWRSYQEDMVNDPLVNQNKYVVRHDPFVLFNDVNGNASYMNSHVRPYIELAGDLQNNTVARYNFITPNLTNDMHDACSGCSSRVYGDLWLSHEVPKILTSQAFSNNGALFITWDEGSETDPKSDGPIGLILLSPLAKGHGYVSAVHHTHSSTLRTMQDIFGVSPYLGDAANATGLSELFVVTNLAPIKLTYLRLTNNSFGFTVTNLAYGRTNYIQGSANLTDWAALKTTLATSNWMIFTDTATSNSNYRFYRVKQAR